MHKGKAKNQSWSDIPFNQPMCHPYQDQDDCCAYVSLDGLCLIHTKLFEYVTSILCLAYKCPIIDLLDLKFKKDVSSPIMDISNLSIMVLLNSSQKD
jgi:hypothetical protein